MTLTPWGDSETLAERALPRTPRPPRDEVERNQRERLLGAMVAVVAEQGYEATRIEDVIQVAGVSRNIFYNRCGSKEDCFLAVLDFLADVAAEAALAAYHDTAGPWNERLASAFRAVAELVAAQPAAARLGLVEVYAAGPDATEHLDDIRERALQGVRIALRDSPEHAEMPTVLVRALLGGLRNVTYNRVREGRTAELPELVPALVDWALSYRTPPLPLRSPEQVPPSISAAAELTGDGPRRRILRAVSSLVAERGYASMTVPDIAAEASLSLSTFYDHFDTKEAAFLATLGDAQRRIIRMAQPFLDAAEDWEHRVSSASHAFFGFMAAEPATAQLGGVGVWATNEAARELRAQGMERFRALLVEGRELHPDTPAIASEAIGASVDALLFDTLRHEGSDRVYAVAPLGTFIMLAPFVGVGRACELANLEPELETHP